MNSVFAFFLIAFQFVYIVVGGQDLSAIDSLKRQLNQSKADTSKFKTLIALSKEVYNLDPKKGLIQANEALVLAEKLNYTKGLALAYKTLGLGYYRLGEYLNAINNWDKAMNIYNKLGDKAGVSNMLNNKGAIYFNQGDNAKALELHLQSLKIAEDISDTLRIITALTNIAADYSDKSATYEKAKQACLRALPLALKIQDSYSTGTVSVNLGEIYFKQNNYDTALKYFEQSIVAYGEGTEDIAYSLNYIGQVHQKRNEFEKAIVKHKEALAISKNLDSKLDIAISLIGLASTYQRMGEFKLAAAHYDEAKKIAVELHANTELRQVYEGLALNYANTKDFQNAYKFQQLLTAINDTIYNIETDKKLQGLAFGYDLDKKQSEINLLTKDVEIEREVTARQKLLRNGFMVGFAVVLLFAGVFFNQRNKIKIGKQRSDELLLNILPEEVAEELKEKGSAEAKLIDEVTVIFTDFKGFTTMSEKLTPKELVKDIHECFSAFDHIMEKHGLEKIKTIGDAYMAAGSLPIANKTHAEDAVKAALEICAFIEEGKALKIAKGAPYFEIRVGVHTGPVVAGIVGVKKFAYDIWGDTVNTASRMESSGVVGKVNISETTYELVKDQFSFEYRGEVEAKGKGKIKMYFVTA